MNNKQKFVELLASHKDYIKDTFKEVIEFTNNKTDAISGLQIIIFTGIMKEIIADVEKSIDLQNDEIAKVVQSGVRQAIKQNMVSITTPKEDGTEAPISQ